jgi:hypothetical protein
VTSSARTAAQDAAVEEIRRRYDATPDLETFEIHEHPADDGVEVVVVVVPSELHPDLPAHQYHVNAAGEISQES